MLGQTIVKRLLVPHHIPCGPFLAIGCCLWGGCSGIVLLEAAELRLPEIPLGLESDGGTP